MVEILHEEFIREEIYKALKQMHPTKALGPDGMLALFYQQIWSVVREDVVKIALEVLNNKADLSNLNTTFLCLIAMIKKPKHIKDFRPISVCNIIFKIITKIIANRLKSILPQIIGEFPSAFVLERLITYNGLVAFDIFHYIRKKAVGNKGYDKGI